MKKVLFILSLLAVLLIPALCAPQAQAATFSGGTGTKADPYRISTAADLWKMAEMINNPKTTDDYADACYKLTTNIILKEKKNWKPIGYSAVGEDLHFAGTFDGNGYTISGIHVQYKEPLIGKKYSSFGLFGNLRGTVTDLVIRDCTFSAEGKSSIYIGAIAGQVYGGTITDCFVATSVSVSGTYQAGGICGDINSTGTLSGCRNAAEVTATANTGSAGGITGRAACPVTNCENSGKITSSGDAAGITCIANAGIAQCENSGTISAYREAAGIVCSFSDGALNHSMNDNTVQLLACTNSGSVTSESRPAGGIAASCRTGSIVDCINSGTISSPWETGGILGYYQNDSFGETCKNFRISGCENSGKVVATAANSAGGICGMIYDNTITVHLIENCVNSGSVVGAGISDAVKNRANAGGILGSGKFLSLEIRGCSNTGSIRGYAVSGGIIGNVSPVKDGENTTLLVADCENSAKIHTVSSPSQDSYAGGIVGFCRTETEDPELLPVFDEVRIENCKNSGKLDGDRKMGKLYTDNLCANDAVRFR